MKRFLILMTIIAMATGAAFSYHRPKQPVQAIGVKIVEANGWSGSEIYLPVVNGYATTYNDVSSGYFSPSGSEDGAYAVSASYQVASSSPGHFFVLAHFKIMRDGISTEVDQALPVQPSYQPSPVAEEKLKRTTWSRLDNHLSAFAYLSDNTLYY